MMAPNGGFIMATYKPASSGLERWWASLSRTTQVAIIIAVVSLSVAAFVYGASVQPIDISRSAPTASYVVSPQESRQAAWEAENVGATTGILSASFDGHQITIMAAPEWNATACGYAAKDILSSAKRQIDEGYYTVLVYQSDPLGPDGARYVGAYSESRGWH